MRSRDRYTFKLEVIYPDDTSTTRWIHPQYDGLTLEYNRESEQKFYRRQLSNDLVLIGDEAREFINESIYNRYRVTIYDRGNKVVRCAFRRTDCEIDKDHWTVKIDPNNDDEYKQLDGTDKEFNLVKLAPAMKSLSVTVRPIIQTIPIHTPTYDTFGYFGKVTRDSTDYETYRDMWQTTRVRGINYSYLHLTLRDGNGASHGGWHALMCSDGNYSPVSWIQSRMFTGYGTLGNADNPDHGVINLIPDDPNYNDNLGANAIKMRLACSMQKYASVQTVTGFNLLLVGNTEKLTEKNLLVDVPERYALAIQWPTGWDCYAKPKDPGLDNSSYSDIDYQRSIDNYSDMWSSCAMGDWGNVTACGIYERIFRIPGQELELYKDEDDTKISGWHITIDTFKTYIVRGCSGTLQRVNNGDWLIEKDFETFISNYIYKFYQEFYLTNNDCIRRSVRTTTEPTEWGTKSDGVYWLPPTDSKQWLPIFTGLWNEYEGSLWTTWDILKDGTFGFNQDINSYFYTQTLKDWYSLGSSIKVLLKQIAPDILFEETPEYSQFLFADNNPITNQKQGRYYILQKSNAINLHYDLAAWKGMITLDKVFEMLKNALNCYYHIDEDNKLHIEHAYYYDNGMTYAQGQDRNLLNLNDWYDGKNRLQLSFRTNRWKYNTEQQADRYEYSWMDGQSEPFEGKPILITDAYNLFKKHQTEKRQISWFSSDIDYLFAFGEDFSNDGFLLVQTEPGSNKVPIGNLTFDGYTRSLQNVFCAMAWLQPAFHLYDLYAAYVECNGELMLVKDRKPIRSQDLTFNIPDSVPFSPQYLVQSLADIGRVETLKIDLTDDKAEATVELPADE